MNNETMNNEQDYKSPQDIQKRTFDFGVRVINLVDRMPRTWASEIVAKQFARSGTAVGALMQEADGAESKEDFIHKVSVAYKEARESRHWLATMQATMMKNDADTATLWKEADEIVRILFAILRKSRSSSDRPSHTKRSR